MAGNVKREAGNLLLEVKGLRVAVAGNDGGDYGLVRQFRSKRGRENKIDFIICKIR